MSAVVNRPRTGSGKPPKVYGPTLEVYLQPFDRFATHNSLRGWAGFPSSFTLQSGSERFTLVKSSPKVGQRMTRNCQQMQHVLDQEPCSSMPASTCSPVSFFPFLSRHLASNHLHPRHMGLLQDRTVRSARALWAGSCLSLKGSEHWSLCLNGSSFKFPFNG